MSVEFWIAEREPCDGSNVRALEAALARSGLVRVAAEGNPGAIGVVPFRQPSAELTAYVRDASNAGQTALVAVAMDDVHVSGAIAWPLRRAGASDVIAGKDLSSTVAALVARIARWAEIGALLRSAAVRETLVGQSPAWLRVLREIVETAAFTDSTILLLGESGTGKELIARMIHALDRRRTKRNLVVLDCTTVVRELSGSEFFGHERGAFTGASCARDGCFALADGGTLFLDEVGELPLPLQAQLLRVIQERTYKRVGSNDWVCANFRLVAATNRSLENECASGGFRQDLFHRIASRTFHIPPLRQRTEDILPLAAHFLSLLRPAEPVVFDAAVREYLLSRPYPGNIRELRQLIGRIGARWLGGGPITVGSIPMDELPADTAGGEWHSGAFDQVIWKALQIGAGLHDIKEAASKRAVALALQMEAGSTRGAAQRLAVTERTVQSYRAERRHDDVPASVEGAAEPPSRSREARFAPQPRESALWK